MRPSWKLPFIFPKFCKKKNKDFIRTRIRNSVIPYSFGENKKKMAIFNGIWFKSKNINKNMVGCKLGEFAFTKPIDKKTHVKKKKKKNKK